MSLLASVPPLVGLPRTSLGALRGALLRDAGWQYVGWLSEMGWAGGADALQAFSSWLAANGEVRAVQSLDPATFQRQAAQYFAASGWGTLDIGTLGPGLLTLDSSDWAEADPHAALPYPGCYVSGGLFGAFFSALGGVTLTALEVECRSTGAPRCRWLLGSPAAIQHVYERMAAGEPYVDAARSVPSA
jgi:hypothetical protein